MKLDSRVLFALILGITLLFSASTAEAYYHRGNFGVRVYIGPGYYGPGPGYGYYRPAYYNPYYYYGGVRCVRYSGYYDYYGYWHPGFRRCWGY